MLILFFNYFRVAPALNLSDLRNQMKEQLGDGDVIPEDYVFLRCVGRCLAIVILNNILLPLSVAI